MVHRKKRNFCYLVSAGFAVALMLPVMLHAEGVSRPFSTIEAVSASIESRQSDMMAIVVDFAVVMQVDEEIGAIVLGNAAIADAMVADGRMIVLTGKSVGITNMIVMDANNQMLAQMTLQVSGRKPGTVTVRRALETKSYACSSGLCTGSSAALADVSVAPSQAPL